MKSKRQWQLGDLSARGFVLGFLWTEMVPWDYVVRCIDSLSRTLS